MYLDELKIETCKVCLYCNGMLKQETISRGLPQYIVLFCELCSERISFENFLNINAVVISCKDIKIAFDNQQEYQIYYDASTSTVVVPMFDLYFSDKDKLYNKLKNYILFS